MGKSPSSRSPVFANLGGDVSVSRSVAFAVVLLMIALIMFIVYFSHKHHRSRQHCGEAYPHLVEYDTGKDKEAPPDANIQVRRG